MNDFDDPNLDIKGWFDSDLELERWFDDDLAGAGSQLVFTGVAESGQGSQSSTARGNSARYPIHDGGSDGELDPARHTPSWTWPKLKKPKLVIYGYAESGQGSESSEASGDMLDVELEMMHDLLLREAA